LARPSFTVRLPYFQANPNQTFQLVCDSSRLSTPILFSGVGGGAAALKSSDFLLPGSISVHIGFRKLQLAWCQKLTMFESRAQRTLAKAANWSGLETVASTAAGTIAPSFLILPDHNVLQV